MEGKKGPGSTFKWPVRDEATEISHGITFPWPVSDNAPADTIRGIKVVKVTEVKSLIPTEPRPYEEVVRELVLALNQVAKARKRKKQYQKPIEPQGLKPDFIIYDEFLPNKDKDNGSSQGLLDTLKNETGD